MDEVMDIPKTTIRKEIDDNFTLDTKPDVKYETQVLDLGEIKVEPIQLIKIEPSASYELEPAYSNQNLKLSKEANILESDNKYLYNDSLGCKDIVKTEVKTEHVESALNEATNKNIINVKEEVIEGDLWLNGIETRPEMQLEERKIISINEKNENFVPTNIKDGESVTDKGDRNSVKVVRPKGAANSSKKKINVDVFKCDHYKMCKYRTNEQRLLQMHLMEHKKPAPASTKKFKCEFCHFETIHLSYLLKRHMPKHKDPANSSKNRINVDAFKCDHYKMCKYRTNEQRLLQMHLMEHEKPAPASTTKFKCEFCHFETIHLSYLLKRHMLKHKDPGEPTMLKCDQCEFQTVDKHHMKYHILRHKKKYVQM